MTNPKAALTRTRTRIAKAAYPIRGLDRLAFLTAPGGPEHEFHLAITPPRVGNIGDQAMVESYAALVNEPIVLIDRERADELRPVHGRGGVTLRQLPDLLYGLGPGHISDVRRFAELVSSARSVSVFGADIMDGNYNVRASVMRSRCAEFAARAGLDTRILGFSWNEAPHPAALRALQRADRAGVRLMARDPRSAERLRAAGLRNVTDVADLVFADRSVDLGPANALKATMADRPVVLVNASGMIGSWFDQLPDYRALVDHLLRMGMNVVMVPHAIRSSADDAATGAAVAEGLPSDRVHAIDRLWSPAQVRGLASRSRMVVTGRMHLSIIGLSQQLPVVAMSTQGKVSGLMSFFDLEHLVIAPKPGMGAAMIAAADTVHRDHAALQDAIARRLPDIMALSRKNVAGLVPTSDR